MGYTNNSNLNKAASACNDEVYTKYSDVSAEVGRYRSQLRGRVVYCPCDGAESNFLKYLINNFFSLGVKRLIATSYTYIPRCRGSLFDSNLMREGKLLDKCFSELQGDGDFRSAECVELLKQADVVITNPPFSLWGDFVSLVVEYGKDFLVLGTINNLAYNAIFPLFMKNEARLGYHYGNMVFRLPEYSELRETRSSVDANGVKYRSLGNVAWFTSLKVTGRYKPIKLTLPYDKSLHRFLDGTEIINVDKVADIPNNCKNTIAVPVTFLTKYCPEQFVILGMARHGSGGFDLLEPKINGKKLFNRILIRRK